MTKQIKRRTDFTEEDFLGPWNPALLKRELLLTSEKYSISSTAVHKELSPNQIWSRTPADETKRSIFTDFLKKHRPRKQNRAFPVQRIFRDYQPATKVKPAQKAQIPRLSRIIYNSGIQASFKMRSFLSSKVLKYAGGRKCKERMAASPGKIFDAQYIPYTASEQYRRKRVISLSQQFSSSRNKLMTRPLSQQPKSKSMWFQSLRKI